MKHNMDVHIEWYRNMKTLLNNALQFVNKTCLRKLYFCIVVYILWHLVLADTVAGFFNNFISIIVKLF